MFSSAGRYLVLEVKAMEWAFEIIRQLSQFHFFVAVAISFTAGLITSFNPCMLGMTASIMSFQNEVSKKGNILIISVFILSFSLTLTVLGLLSSYFGEQILMWNERHGSNLYSVIAIIFAILGCYLIGIRIHHLLRWLPFRIVAFYSKQKKLKQQKPIQPVVKAFTLGGIFGVTPSPCTTPMILAMLTYSTTTGSLPLGGLLLLAYGIGHGMPFFIMGWISAAIRRSRRMMQWQRWINKGLGFSLIMIGLYFFFFENSPMPM
jgi:cytochrome c-type biogenesis protein